MQRPIAQTLIGLGAILDRNGVQRKDLARGISCTPETVSRWVMGDVTPGGRTVLRIVSYLRRHEPTLRVDDLFAKDGRAEAMEAAAR